MIALAIALLTPIAPAPAASPNALGAPVPVFSALDLGGKDVELSAYAGKPLLLNLWATWCAPCEDELPLLEALHRTWGPRGVQVLGVAVERDPAPVRRIIERYALTYPILVDADDAATAAFAIKFIPATYLYDARGRLVWMRADVVRPSDPELKAALAALGSSK